MPQLLLETYEIQGVSMFVLCIFFYFFFTIYLIPTFNQSLKLREYLLDEIAIQVKIKKQAFSSMSIIQSYKNIYLIKWFHIFLPYSNAFINDSLNLKLKELKKNYFSEANNYYNMKYNNYLLLKQKILSKNKNY